MSAALVFAILCVVAMGVNLGVQYLALNLGKLSLWPAIAMGTGAGLVSKFIMDKLWVFHDSENFSLITYRQFGLYVATGLYTTALFWLVEWLFVAAFSSEAAQYFGGAMGLTLGYFAKYHLDKNFVFNANANERE